MVESWIVIPVVVGSNPIRHPNLLLRRTEWLVALIPELFEWASFLMGYLRRTVLGAVIVCRSEGLCP